MVTLFTPFIVFKLALDKNIAKTDWLVSIEQYFSYVQGENKLRII
jgi:hypothetical protein